MQTLFGEKNNAFICFRGKCRFEYLIYVKSVPEEAISRASLPCLTGSHDTDPKFPEPKLSSSAVGIRVPEHESWHRGARVPCRSHKWGEDTIQNRHILHR